MISFGMFTACQQEEFAPETKINEIANDYVPEGDPMILGKQLENPYSVENMKKALNNLTINGRVSEDVIIETTHLYIRFLPKDTVEVGLLEADTTIELFDYPLDFEIEQVGNWYHDPIVPDNLPTWQYTVVAPDFTYPNVKYEVLSNLFLIDDEEEESGRISNSLWDNLETEALKITNNLDPSELANNTNARRGKWRPNGRIMVEERSGGNPGEVPLRNCKVRAQRWFKWASTNTNGSTGKFYFSTRFKREVNYSLKFQNSGFKVTNFFGFATKHNGPKREGPWNMNIAFSNGSESWVRATFMNAIYHFETQAYKHRIKLPGLLTTVKVRPVFKDGRSNAVGVIRHNIPIVDLVFRNDVRIFTKDGNTPIETDDIYSVMMHELGHVSHYLNSPINFQLYNGMAIESWANVVEYYFTLPYYANKAKRRIDKNRKDIIWGGNWKYTPFFIDLRDTTNQRNDNGGNTDWADDNVKGYTLEQMQKALNNRTSISGVCAYLRKHYTNPTENNLDDLLAFYTDIKDNH